VPRGKYLDQAETEAVLQRLAATGPWDETQLAEFARVCFVAVPSYGLEPYLPIIQHGTSFEINTVLVYLPSSPLSGVHFSTNNRVYCLTFFFLRSNTQELLPPSQMSQLKPCTRSRRLWSAAEQECLLTHIERHKGSDGKWIKSYSEAMKEVLVELEAVKPSSAASLTERQITNKLRDNVRRTPGSRLAKSKDLFIKGPVALNVRKELGIGLSRSRREVTAGPIQFDKVLNPLSLETHEVF
jgi:hypothetical protein